MKLQLRTLEDGLVGGGVAFVLTDENGVMLPNQRDVRIDQQFTETPLVTVTFVVDGRNLSFLPTREPAAQ